MVRASTGIAALPGTLDGDIPDARRRFEAHVLRTSQPVLERYRFVGRGGARMMRRVHPGYVAELRVIVQLAAWERTGLVEARVIGVPTAHSLILDLIGRIRESRDEHIRSAEIVATVGAMFFWWYAHCARHAPERLGADVEIHGRIGDRLGDLLEEMARLLWSRRRGDAMNDRG